MFLTLRFTNRSAIDETRPVLTVPWAAPYRILAEVCQFVASGRLWKFPDHTILWSGVLAVATATARLWLKFRA